MDDEQEEGEGTIKIEERRIQRTILFLSYMVVY
jgi:hypothetical protein